MVGDAEKQIVLWAQLDAHRVTLGMTQDEIRRIYLHLLLTRLTDQRLAQLWARGIIPNGPSCRGHEAAQVGCVAPLRIGQDYILPYYRDLGVMLAIGMPPATILLNQLGRGHDPISGGRMRPAQWNDRPLRVVSASGLVGTQTLHAAGIAFAARLRGEPAIAITFFGEGATSEGDFHEALNFAGLHRLGVIFVCENNGIALSTPQARQMPVAYVADRAAAYGMPGVVVDGTNVLAVISAAREAFARARQGHGPTLLEIIVPRYGEATGDADDEQDLSDPVMLFRGYLLARGDLSPELDRRFHRQITGELDEAEREALAVASPDPATAAEGVTGDPDTTSEEGGDARWQPKH